MATTQMANQDESVEPLEIENMDYNKLTLLPIKTDKYKQLSTFVEYDKHKLLFKTPPVVLMYNAVSITEDKRKELLERAGKPYTPLEFPKKTELECMQIYATVDLKDEFNTEFKHFVDSHGELHNYVDTLLNDKESDFLQVQLNGKETNLWNSELIPKNIQKNKSKMQFALNALFKEKEGKGKNGETTETVSFGLRLKGKKDDPTNNLELDVIVKDSTTKKYKQVQVKTLNELRDKYLTYGTVVQFIYEYSRFYCEKPTSTAIKGGFNYDCVAVLINKVNEKQSHPKTIINMDKLIAKENNEDNNEENDDEPPQAKKQVQETSQVSKTESDTESNTNSEPEDVKPEPTKKPVAKRGGKK